MSSENIHKTLTLPLPISLATQSTWPLTDLLRRLGEKWSVLIVVVLGQRSFRFNDLHRSIEGISQRMLTRTLRSLELDGFITRTVHPTGRPSVEYRLTDLGRTLLEPINELANWARVHEQEIKDSRSRTESS